MNQRDLLWGMQTANRVTDAVVMAMTDADRVRARQAVDDAAHVVGVADINQHRTDHDDPAHVIQEAIDRARYGDGPMDCLDETVMDIAVPMRSDRGLMYDDGRWSWADAT